MADIFQNILKKAAAQQALARNSVDATNWLRTTASKATSRHVNTPRILAQKQMQTRATGAISIGSMYLFNYDPKHKATLPYYDRFPLVFPFDYADGGFYGLNMHYLPPMQRAMLMDALSTLQTTAERDPTTALAMSYDILKKSSRFKYFKPCVKHYLNSHVRSPFYAISPEEWDVALFLPLQRFQGAKAGRVYSDSLNKV